jgi:hypothetical protein
LSWLISFVRDRESYHPQIMDTKACSACALAKRRCGKQRPHCLRCAKRGVECRYPPTKPARFVRCDGESALAISQNTLPHSVAQSPAFSRDGPQFFAGAPHVTALPPGEPQCIAVSQGESQCSPFSSGLFSLFNERTPYAAIDPLRASIEPSKDQPRPIWVDSWAVDRFPQAERNTYTALDLKRTLGKIMRWLTQWIEEGSNPIIHSQLYKNRFPRSIRDAFAAVSCYAQKKASNEQIIFRIIEEQAKQLLADHGVAMGDAMGASQAGPGASSTNADPLEHLARVQALLIYQLLGLYDGDIRLRHLAESSFPILNSWMHQMLESASSATCLGSAVISANHDPWAFSSSLTDAAHWENLLWYSWIYAESLRRTWLVASGIQGIFLVIQRELPIPCQGAMMFTTRQGIWEARSSMAWERLCSGDVKLTRIAEADQLFTEAPKEVNDFSKVILEIVFGAEKMERWGVSADD